MDDAEGNLFVLDTGGLYLDTDGDGIPDWWERMYSGTATGLVANADSDGDGHTELEEYITQYDPGDAGSVFRVIEVYRPDPDVPWQWTITWETTSDRMYKVYAHDDLKTPWPAQPLYQVQGDGTPKSYTNTQQNLQPRFYRISVEIYDGP